MTNQPDNTSPKPDRQFALRVDPEIYRLAKAKAALEQISMRDLFTRMLKKYISEEE